MASRRPTMTLEQAQTPRQVLRAWSRRPKSSQARPSSRRRRQPALCAAAQDLSAERARHLPPHQVDRARRHARHLLRPAVRALGPRPERAGPGGADRFSQPALLFLLHRDLAAGSLLPHRPADPRGDDAVPDERGRRPRLVRLSLPADGVDRPVLGHRALRRGRPARAHAARRRTSGRSRLARARAPSISSG